jgi:hypothetical protein
MPGPWGKRAPYGKRGLNEGVLATTNGVLDDVIGLSPFGIYCQTCKTKIAFSTFKNHIRDAHSECFTPQAVNYAAVSREYERLVEEKREGCRDFEQYVTGEICDRFQCTSCECLFDNKSNAKRHFLSMKMGCSDASLTIAKCRKTTCYRAVTLTGLDRLIQEAKKKTQEDLAKELQVKQDAEAAASKPPAEEEEVPEPTTSSGSSSSNKKKSGKRPASTKAEKTSSSKKKKTSSSTSTNIKKKHNIKKETETETTTTTADDKKEAADVLAAGDDDKKPAAEVVPSPVGVRSSARLRRRRTY